MKPKACISPVQIALSEYLKKWYPQYLEKDKGSQVSGEEEKYNIKSIDAEPVSIVATSINVEKNFRLDAIKGLRREIEELKNGLQDVSDGGEGREESGG